MATIWFTSALQRFLPTPPRRRGGNGRRSAGCRVRGAAGAARLRARRPGRAAPTCRGLRQRRAGAGPHRAERSGRARATKSTFSRRCPAADGGGRGKWRTGSMSQPARVCSRSRAAAAAGRSSMRSFSATRSRAVLAEAEGTVYAALDLGHFGAKLWRRDRCSRRGARLRRRPFRQSPKTRRRSASVVARQDLGDRAGRRCRAAMGRDDAGRAVPLRRWRRDSWSLNETLWRMPERRQWVRRRRRRAARHQLGAGRSARSRRHPRRRIDRRGVGEPRRRRLVAAHQPRHVHRIHAAGAARDADRAGHPPAGALRRIPRHRVVPAS